MLVEFKELGTRFECVGNRFGERFDEF